MLVRVLQRKLIVLEMVEILIRLLVILTVDSNIEYLYLLCGDPSCFKSNNNYFNLFMIINMA